MWEPIFRLTTTDPCAVAANNGPQEFDEEMARAQHQAAREQHGNERGFRLLVEAQKIRLTIVALKKVFWEPSRHEVLCVAVVALAAGERFETRRLGCVSDEREIVLAGEDAQAAYLIRLDELRGADGLNSLAAFVRKLINAGVALKEKEKEQQQAWEQMKKYKRDLRAAQGMQEPRPRPEEMSRWEKQQPEPAKEKDVMQTSAGLRMQAARARGQG
jgi:hypothetical protein